MPNRFLKISLLLLCSAFSLSSADAAVTAPMTVRAQADTTNLVMGDRTRVQLQIVKNSHNGILLDMPEPGADYHGLELSSVSVDSTDLGNGRVQLDYDMVFQAFYPADILTLPGFSYACDGDTVTSDILTFRVYPVDIPEELGDIEQPETLQINPDAPPMSVKAHFFDWLRDWMWLSLLGALLVAALVVLFILYKKNGPRLFFPPKPVPPYDLAMAGLREIKAKGMIENSQPKMFYTAVTDVFRNYLEGRFDINAMEMTSKQILERMRQNKEIHLSAGQLEQILELSDFVKFAAFDPTPEERMRTYKTVYEFVEQTKPAEEDPAPAKAKKSKSHQMKKKQIKKR